MAKNITVNGNEYVFTTSCYSTRYGFNHECTLTRNGEYLNSRTAHYHNRTWESYPFHNVMAWTIREVMEMECSPLREAWKKENNYKNMTEKRIGEFENYLATSDNATLYREYKEVYEKLA